MNKFFKVGAVALLAVAMIGCGDSATPEKKEESKETAAAASMTQVSLESDLCGKCGDSKGTESCCKGEKCECGMQKGTDLCCSGVESKDVTYCKSCGHEKGTESCCADGNEECGKCGLAKGAPICCKVKSHDHDGHDHDGHDHDDHK